ncbi:MAG: hypothetical protein E7386_01190 [Ruminococcaceae bacterium]|nr:hypothetical protein [Oscillospiraceae bacterium]
MQSVKRAICVTLMLTMLLALAACGGPKKDVKKYYWGGYQFTVRKTEINDSGSLVTVVLEWDKNGIPKSLMEENIKNGNVLFYGKKPMNSYLYKKNKDGNVTQVNLNFGMSKEKDYVFNEADLEIKE